MAKQTINIGTSANKGDGDPLRTAFDKVNDNFTELYSDVKQLNSVNFGGGTLTSDIVGDVFAHDSTHLVDANNGKIVGPIESTVWSNTSNIEISTGGTLTLKDTGSQDYITVSSSGVVLFSDSLVAIRTNGQDIQIGFNVGSGNTEIGHNSSTTRVNGTFEAKRFAKVEVPQYDNAGLSGIAPTSPDGAIIYNTDNRALEAKVDGTFVKVSATDLSEFTDNTNVIPSDVSDLSDNTVKIKSDVSQLTDNNGRIPNDIGDLVAGGNVGDMLVKTSTGYGFTAPAAAETFTLSTMQSVAAASADFADFQSRIAAL